MQLRLNSYDPLPRSFAAHPKAKGVVCERDLRIGTSRLRAKLLIFENRSQLRGFWKDVLGKGDLGPYCFGCVNGLINEVQHFNETEALTPRHLEADPRYFCVIGLVKGYLTPEIVAHEAVHAAFCYTKRIARSPWDAQAGDFDEEKICYPAGRIANEIVKAGLAM